MRWFRRQLCLAPCLTQQHLIYVPCQPATPQFLRFYACYFSLFHSPIPFPSFPFSSTIYEGKRKQRRYIERDTRSRDQIFRREWRERRFSLSDLKQRSSRSRTRRSRTRTRAPFSRIRRCSMVVYFQIFLWHATGQIASRRRNESREQTLTTIQ